mmetsp:Transcript_13859/g.31996  ORF Transcript_13859/g.31996 Transcript_13859/m.31996 type:complete len:93 (-) Transcript_13859:4354-4632(-)
MEINKTGAGGGGERRDHPSDGTKSRGKRIVPRGTPLCPQLVPETTVYAVRVSNRWFLPFYSSLRISPLPKARTNEDRFRAVASQASEQKQKQ